MRIIVKLLITICSPAILCAAFSIRADAAVFVVNSTVDATDASAADGICQTATVANVRCALQLNRLMRQPESTPSIS